MAFKNMLQKYRNSIHRYSLFIGIFDTKLVLYFIFMTMIYRSLLIVALMFNFKLGYNCMLHVLTSIIRISNLTDHFFIGTGSSYSPTVYDYMILSKILINLMRDHLKLS